MKEKKIVFMQCHNSIVY